MIRGPKYCRDHHSDLAAFTGHTVPKRSVGLVYKETIIIQIPFQLSDSEEYSALNTALGVEQGFCPSLTLLHLQRHLVL